MLEIRREIPEDFQQIRHLTISAFEHTDFGHHGEADLIELLRETSEPCLSIVAAEGNQIVGHAMFSPVTFEHPPSRVGMGLGPMSVAIERQRRGIGTRLIEAGIETLKDNLKDNASTYLVVLGHPSYYPRHGFKLASEYGFEHGFEGIPQDVFFAMNLGRTTHGLNPRSQVRFANCFGPQFVSVDDS